MNNKNRILAIDDSPDTLSLLVNILTEESYDVFAADSGELALISIEKIIPDLILLDIQMSGINGFEVCEKIKSNYKLRNIPVVFLTGATDISDRIKGFQAGAVDYIQKPFEKEELIARVKTHIDLYSYNKLFTEITAQQLIEKEKLLNVQNAELNKLNDELKISQIELKKAKEIAEETAKNLKKVQEIAHLGSWEWDIKCNKVTWSDEMKRIWGLDPSIFIGDLDKIISKSIHPDDIEKVNESNKIVSELGQPIPMEYRIIRPDKTIRTIWAEAGELIKDEEGKPILLTGIVLDITERKETERLLIEQNMQLEQQYEEYMQLNEVLRATNYDLEVQKSKAEESDKLKTAFLQNMSHEIRTPLNGIIGFSSLLQDETNDFEIIKEYTSIIQQSGVRLLELVNNVLDISKIETGQINIDMKSFAIDSLFRDLAVFFTPLAESRKINLIKKNDYYSSKNIYSDETKINQIMINLISNSIKFTKKGSIEFGCEPINNEIRFFVKDTGIGISEENFEKIFDRFTQADLKITRGYEGAGLGLAICKGLVELLGGKIWIESKLNVGSTFYFTIPLIETNIQDDNVTFKFEEDLIISRSTILIAEDDWTSFQYISKLLLDFDVEILHAENGQESVEFVRTNPNIVLILMDIKMPIMNGIEATKLIKEIRPNLPIIAQTAYAFSTEKDEILAIGCSDYIAKPIPKNSLLQLIKKHV